MTPISPARSAPSWRWPRRRPRSSARYVAQCRRFAQRATRRPLKPSDITARLGAPWMPGRGSSNCSSAEQMGVTSARSVIPSRSRRGRSNCPRLCHGSSGRDIRMGDRTRRHAGVSARRRAQRRYPADLRSPGSKPDVHRAAQAERARHRSCQGEARQDQDQAFERWVWHRRRPGTTRLSRGFTTTGSTTWCPADLRWGTSSAPRCVERSSAMRRAPEAGGLAHHQRRARPTSRTRWAPVRRSAWPPRSWSNDGSGWSTKAMMVVPGHCLAQASRDFLLLYPNAQILVADEANFVKEKRQPLFGPCRHRQLGLHHHHAQRPSSSSPAPAAFEARADRRADGRATSICSTAWTATTASPASGMERLKEKHGGQAGGAHRPTRTTC